MKRTFEPTRRRKALRTCTVFLVLMVLIHLTRGWFCLTPGMARRQAEARNGFGETRCIWQEWETWNWSDFTHPPCCQLTLVETDGVTALHWNYPTVLGWSWGCNMLDCTTPGPVWYREFTQWDDGQRRILVYGRVDDPAAERLELKIAFYTEGSENSTVPVPGTTAQVYSMDSDEWLSADGRWYFIFRQEYTRPERDAYFWKETSVTFYDASGAVIE